MVRRVRRAYREVACADRVIRVRRRRCRMSRRRHVVRDPHRACGELVVDGAGPVVVVAGRPSDDRPTALGGDRCASRRRARRRPPSRDGRVRRTGRRGNRTSRRGAVAPIRGGGQDPGSRRSRCRPSSTGAATSASTSAVVVDPSPDLTLVLVRCRPVVERGVPAIEAGPRLELVATNMSNHPIAHARKLARHQRTPGVMTPRVRRSRLGLTCATRNTWCQTPGVQAFSAADLGGDGWDYLVEIADHRVARLGHHVRFAVGVDGDDVLARHRADPVLDRA